MDIKEAKKLLITHDLVLYKGAKCSLKFLKLWHNGEEFIYSAGIQEVNNKNANYEVNLREVENGSDPK